MELMERWFQMISQQPRIGGIPVLYDNVAYANSGGYVTDFISDPNFFITGIFDTGTTSSKSVTYHRIAQYLSNGNNFSWRSFNTLESRSAGDWTAGGYLQDRTVNASGRFILYPIRKDQAANMFMYYTVDGVKHYLFKGDNVTV